MELDDREAFTKVMAKALALISVTREAIEALIASHPDPLALQREWRARTLEAVDAEIDTPPFGVAEYREAFVGNMEGLSHLIDDAARRSGEDSRS